MGKHMTPEVFAEAVEGLNISERPIAMARAVLVDGKRQIEVAREQGVSRAAVSLAVNRIVEAHSEVPEGFERVTAILPRHKAAIVRQWRDSAAQDMESAR